VSANPLARLTADRVGERNLQKLRAGGAGPEGKLADGLPAGIQKRLPFSNAVLKVLPARLINRTPHILEVPVQVLQVLI
jgi:hypothetical protein